MTDDAATNGPPTPPGGGERRRALEAERERHVESRIAESGPPPPPALVRPYARMAAPTAPVPAVGEPGSSQSSSGEETAADTAPDAGQPDAGRPDAGQPDAAEARGQDDDGDVASPGTEAWASWDPDAEPKAAATALEPDRDAEPRHDDPPQLQTDDDSAEHVLARLRDSVPPAAQAPLLDRSDSAPPRVPALPRSGVEPGEPAESPAASGKPHGAPPEMAPPGWSAFTPVVTPGPLPFDTDHPVSGEWEHVSRDEGDDDSWLRVLRGRTDPEPAVDLTIGEPTSLMEPEDAPPERLGQTLSRDADDPLDVPPVDIPRAEGSSEVPDSTWVAYPVAGVSDKVPDGSVNGSGPDQGGAGRPWVELVDGSRPGDAADDHAPEDEEQVRGTLAPVLRRSTQRAKYPTSTTPVIRPPVLPAPLGEAPPTPRARIVSWEEALAGDVVPGTTGRRTGRRVAKARHESAGAGEYRPRAARDHSLTLLVVGMLLVLLLLVGVAVWVFWPRVAGTGSQPAPSPTTPTTTDHG
jgi:hypothetical protein